MAKGKDWSYLDFCDAANNVISSIRVYGTKREQVSTAYMLWAYRDLLCPVHCVKLKIVHLRRKNDATSAEKVLEISE